MRLPSSFACAVLLTSAVLNPAPAEAQVQQRVQFARGQNSTVVQGVVRGRQYVDYLVSVRAGERLSVWMTSNHRAASFNLLAPRQYSRAYYVGINSRPPNRFDGTVPQRGTQRIRVYLYGATDRRDHLASYQLHISVGGRPGWDNRPVPLPGPAYPDQGFRPVGTIRCELPGTGLVQCAASVRHLGPGQTYVQVRAPYGIVRTITYQNGQAVSIDSGPPGGAFVAARRGNETVVGVGNEAYYVPDALIYAR